MDELRSLVFSHIVDTHARRHAVFCDVLCLCWRPNVAGLADGERQAHLKVRPHRGVGDPPGFTHHSALPSHTQPSGKPQLSTENDGLQPFVG